MIFVRLLLWPVSVLYGLIIQLRNFCYQSGIFKTTHFPKTVISIGNITAGGTGKTPFTIYLAGALIAKGKKISVVSRGYGRDSRGFQLVSDGINFYGNTKMHGDEAVLIARSLPQAIVAVCENRAVAVQKILADWETDIILLDDAFQHRAIHRNLDIVMLAADNSIKNRLVLPSGMLREFFFNIKRADLLISSAANQSIAGKEIIGIQFRLKEVIDLNFDSIGSVADLQNKTYLAIAGIAQPYKFKQDLLQNSVKLKKFIPYKDHYNYTKNDIDFFLAACHDESIQNILCTEKDLVKIKEIHGVEAMLQQEGINLMAIRLSVYMPDIERFLKKPELHL
jgi:tetraacyldisaccharide 4'-kinase